MTRLAITVPLLLALAVVARAAPVPKEIKTSAGPIDGTWVLVSRVADGKETGGKPFFDGGTTWEVKGGSLRIGHTPPPTANASGTSWSSYILSWPRDEGVGAMNHVYDDRTIVAKPCLGRYELDGVTLRVCFTRPGGKRPAKVAEGEGVEYLVFERATADDATGPAWKRLFR